MTKTSWFSWRIKPVHIGWYESTILHRTFLYWNGAFWATSEGGSRIAFCFPDDKWRGLTEPAV